MYFADVTLHALRMIKSVSFSKLQTAPSRCSLSEIKVQGWPGACGKKHLFRIRRDWSHSICARLIVLLRLWKGAGGGGVAQLKGASVWRQVQLSGGGLVVGRVGVEEWEGAVDGTSCPLHFKVRSWERRSLRCPLLVGRGALWHSVHLDESQSKTKGHLHCRNVRLIFCRGTS